MRWCHPVHWWFTVGIICVCVCVFTVIFGGFKTEPTPLAVIRNSWQIVWNGFLFYHLSNPWLPWTKKQVFGLAFVMWNTCHNGQVLPALFQMPLHTHLHIMRCCPLLRIHSHLRVLMNVYLSSSVSLDQYQPGHAVTQRWGNQSKTMLNVNVCQNLPSRPSEVCSMWQQTHQVGSSLNTHRVPWLEKSLVCVIFPIHRRLIQWNDTIYLCAFSSSLFIPNIKSVSHWLEDWRAFPP